MSKSTVYLTTSWTDEFGGTFPNAYMQIWDVSIFPRISLTNNKESESYDEDSVLDGLSYRVNFWYEKDNKKNGFDSRPLMYKPKGEDAELSNVIKVDLEHFEAALIQSGDLPIIDKAFALIESDIKRLGK